MIVLKWVVGDMHMCVFETCKHFSFSDESEGNCTISVC